MGQKLKYDKKLDRLVPIEDPWPEFIWQLTIPGIDDINAMWDALQAQLLANGVIKRPQDE